MTDDRLPTALVVSAALHRCAAEGTPAYVARRGASAGGMILLKLTAPGADAVRLLSQSRDLEGRPGWLAAGKGDTMTEADAEAYIARAIARDPDLWVIEIEHRAFWHPFEGRIL